MTFGKTAQALVFTAVAGIGAGLFSGYTLANQPRMQSALSHLQAAENELQAADNDKAVGHTQDAPAQPVVTTAPATVAPPPEPVKVQAGGQRGRKTGLREVTKYIVTDHTKALAFFAESEDVKELVSELAERASKAGVAVPGVEKRIEEVAA